MRGCGGLRGLGGGEGSKVATPLGSKVTRPSLPPLRLPRRSPRAAPCCCFRIAGHAHGAPPTNGWKGEGRAVPPPSLSLANRWKVERRAKARPFQIAGQWKTEGKSRSRPLTVTGQW